MSILADVNARITLAMKAHDAPTLSALRMLKSALTNKEVEKGRALEAGEELQVVAAQIKQRRDSIEQFHKGGREDLAAKFLNLAGPVIGESRGREFLEKVQGLESVENVRPLMRMLRLRA